MTPIHRALPLVAAVAAVAAATLATPATAPAAWSPDHTFGTSGRSEHRGGAWTTPALAVAGGAGRTVIVNDDGDIQQLTATGRADRTFGTVGLTGNFEVSTDLVRWGRTTLAYEVDPEAAPSTPEPPTALVLDARGQDTPAGAALRKTLGPTGMTERWLVPRTANEVVALVRRGATTNLRRIGRDGGVRADATVRWPRSLGDRARPQLAPVWSGGALVAVVMDSDVGAQRLVRILPSGRVRAIARVPRNPLAVLRARGGGAIVVGDRETRWYSRSGRALGHRRIRAAAAAVDGAGRVLIARAGDDYRHVSVLRLRRDRRIDTAFGRLTLRGSGRANPQAIVVHPDHRVVVVASMVAYETYSDIREDFTSLVERGTVAWRVRPTPRR